MKIRAAILALTGIMAWNVSASAQDIRPVPTRYQGRDGLWFQLEEGRAAVSALAEVQGLRPRVRLLEDQLELAEGELADVRAALELADQARLSAEESLAGARLQLTSSDEAAAEARTRAATAAGERDVWAGLAIGAGAVAVVLGVILGAVLGG